MTSSAPELSRRSRLELDRTGLTRRGRRLAIRSLRARPPRPLVRWEAEQREQRERSGDGDREQVVDGANPPSATETIGTVYVGGPLPSRLRGRDGSVTRCPAAFRPGGVLIASDLDKATLTRPLDRATLSMWR
jgi:hypothetical protein